MATYIGNRKIIQLFKGDKRIYSINEGGVLPTGFEYLTYFKDIDVTNKIEYPLIGQQKTFDTNYTISNSAIVINNYIYPCIQLYDNEDRPSLLFTEPLTTQGKFTIDFFIQFPTTTPYSYLIISSCRNGLHALWADRNKVTWTSLTKTLDWNEYSNYRINIDQGIPVHYAYEWDLISNILNIFLNGIKVMTYTLDASVKPLYTDPYKGLFVTQYAIRQGHFSNGDTFPVPTKPYHKNSCIKLGKDT